MTPESALKVANTSLKIFLAITGFFLIIISMAFIRCATGDFGDLAFEEPWIRFATLCYLPMCFLMLARITQRGIISCIIAMHTTRTATEGGENCEIQKRPMSPDVLIIFAFMFVGTFVCKTIYPLVEGMSPTYCALIGLVEAVTCVAVMKLYGDARARLYKGLRIAEAVE